jgi:YHS domain-containing protein
MNVRDPVCGREIGLGVAMAAEVHFGWVFFFCTAGCHEAFRSSPEQYAQEPEALLANLPVMATRQSRNTK